MRFKVLLAVLIVLLCSSSVAAVIQVQSEAERVVMRVPLEQQQGLRVWHTPNPMKVIVDLGFVLSGAPDTLRSSDVALQQVRTSINSDTGNSRIVLDFNYQLPEPQWYIADGHLVVTINKVFNWSSSSFVSQGVYYGHQRRGSAAGPLIVNYLDIKITDPGIQLRSMLAGDQVFGRELVSSMAGRSQAIAAVNGAYFASDGRPLGVLAIDGELISEPFASRTAIGLGAQKVLMDNLDAAAYVWASHGQTAITGMNRPRLQDDLIVYTPHYGASTNTNVYGLDVVVQDGRVVRVVEGSTTIPRDGVVLSGHGQGRAFLAQLRPGDPVEYHVELEPNWFGDGITEIIGGGPRLVKDGEVFITGAAERFQNDITQGRAPRTALGLTNDGRLLVVTVNGRSPNISVGMTLEELAGLMIELGAVDAMNLDGGGSTTMIIRNRVLNIPSDGRERPVSNALVVSTQESRGER